ncbi:MAG: hypothetical protein VYD59_03310 [Bacteroidota bacterium]|nr:hypothetical protein [Bacteroidota bacterium]
MKKVLQIFLVALIFSSCSNVIVPYYTTVDKITKVNPGMTKDQVVETLEIAPYEIFHGIEGGCEIHQFKYKHKEISHGTLNSYANNNKGAERFVDPSNVYVYYRDGKVESLVTDAGKSGGSMVLSFAKQLESACEGPEPEVIVYGCMDKKSLNYDKNATEQRNTPIVESGTILTIGDCEYCICDYKPNKKYDPVKNCGERCVPNNKPKKEKKKKEKVQVELLGSECTLCDLAEKDNAQINIDLTHKSGRLWNRNFNLNEYISKVLNGIKLKEVKSNNKNN